MDNTMTKVIAVIKIAIDAASAALDIFLKK